MRKIIYSLLFFTLLLLNMTGHTQVNQDSVLTASVKRIQSELQFSDAVAAQVLVVFKDQMHDMQLWRKQAPAEKRKEQLQKIVDDANSRLQQLLTPEQRTLYQKRQAAKLEQFKEQMKKEKIKARELKQKTAPTKL